MKIIMLKKKQLFASVFVACAFITVLVGYFKCQHTHHYKALGKIRQLDVDKDKLIQYDRNIPLVFIGGVPRSGTTLMRAMLDAHSEVRCGEETRLIPRILGLKAQWFKSSIESERLKEAGITLSVINDAIASFILEIIVKHGEPAPLLCNKDPFTHRYSQYLSELFPNSRFILMARDGRAVVHSIISRKITITGFDLKDFKQCLTKWNSAFETMYSQCVKIGSSRCLVVPYEQLVLHPRTWMGKVSSFLDIPMEDSMLHHQDFINKKGGISLSQRERSSDQVVKPLYYESLTKWVGNVPKDIVPNMASIAPMLRVLGYDPDDNSPKYGEPELYKIDLGLKLDSNSSVAEPYT